MGRQLKNTDTVSISDGNAQELVTIKIHEGSHRLNITVTNANTGSDFALDEFEVQRRVFSTTTPSTIVTSAWETLANIASDYLSPQIPILTVSTDMTILAKNASGHITIDVLGIDAIRLNAACSGSTRNTDLTYYWQQR